MPRLNPVDPFPKLTLSTTDGQLTTAPDAFAEAPRPAAVSSARRG
jgi:hypothetical protein